MVYVFTTYLQTMSIKQPLVDLVLCPLSSHKGKTSQGARFGDFAGHHVSTNGIQTTRKQFLWNILRTLPIRLLKGQCVSASFTKGCFAARNCCDPAWNDKKNDAKLQTSSALVCWEWWQKFGQFNFSKPNNNRFKI